MAMMTPLVTATAASSAKLCPSFTGLPVELRLQIYKFPIRDTIEIFLPQLLHDHFISGSGYSGALALLHTSRMLRAESLREMLAVVEAEHARREAYSDKLENLRAKADYAYTQDQPFHEDIPAYKEVEEAEEKACMLLNLKFMVELCLSKPAPEES